MKKNIVIIAVIIALSSQLNAMEIQPFCGLRNIPAEIINLIVNFLTFDDVESEEEFINREKSCSQYPPIIYKSKLIKYYTGDIEVKEFDEGEELYPEYLREYCEEEWYPESLMENTVFKNKRVMPLRWLQKHKNITDPENIYFIIYSPNNSICAMTYGSPLVSDVPYNLSIVDIKTDQELSNICLKKGGKNEKEKYYHHLAISSSGNIFATLYIKKINGDIGFQSLIKIKNISTQKKEFYNYPSDIGTIESIAFDKQSKHLIIHGIKLKTNAHILKHRIVELTTTSDNHKLPKKTLTHYFAQKMVCKNFISQYKKSTFTHKKCKCAFK